MIAASVLGGVALVIGIIGIVVLILYETRCKGCANGCRFTAGIFAKECRCEGCKAGLGCDKKGRCICPTGCSVHGTCQEDGTCKCKNQYSGTDCTTPPTALEKAITFIKDKLHDVCPNMPSPEQIQKKIEDSHIDITDITNVGNDIRIVGLVADLIAQCNKK